MTGASGPGPRFRTWSDANHAGQAQLRIGDAEREAAAAALGEHYANGRLTKEEYDERSAVVFEARTLAALQPLFADLPLPHGPLSPTPPPRASGPAPTGPRRGPGFRMPWIPIIVLLVVASAITHLPLWLIAVGAWVFWSARRKNRWGHTSGSCVGARGTWR